MFFSHTDCYIHFAPFEWVDNNGFAIGDEILLILLAIQIDGDQKLRIFSLHFDTISFVVLDGREIEVVLQDWLVHEQERARSIKQQLISRLRCNWLFTKMGEQFRMHEESGR